MSSTAKGSEIGIERKFPDSTSGDKGDSPTTDFLIQ
jgi:hypothetical protein